MRAPVTLLVLFSVFALCVGNDAQASEKANAKKAFRTGDAKAGERKAQLCILCHRPGNGMRFVPLLEGQPARYLFDQMKAYKENRRQDPAMLTNTANLTDRDMRDIAQYFSKQPAKRETDNLDVQKTAAGKAKAEERNCTSCHSTQGKHQSVPSIAGQRPFYIRSQLEAFASGKRAHGSGPMAAPTSKLSAEEAESLAHYFAQVEQ